MGLVPTSGNDLATLFARAPFEDQGWDTALRALAHATGSARGQLIAVGEQQTLFNWMTDEPRDMHEILCERALYTPEANYRIAAAAHCDPLAVAWEEHYDQIRRTHNDDTYLHFIRQLDAENGAQMVLSRKPDHFFGLAVLRTKSDGRTSEDQRRILQDAGPHVLNAIRMQTALEHKGAALLRGSLEAMDNAVVLIDTMGKVCAVTEAARRLLGPQTLQIRGQCLHAATGHVERLLQVQIGEALQRPLTGPCELWLPGPDGPLLVEICRLPEQEWAFAFAPRVAVTLKTPTRLHEGHGHQIGNALDLTAAESEIVALLAMGLSRRDIASRRNVSVQTVSSQLRTVFQKTGVHREAELVSIARAVIELPRR